jgi:uncharacterized protein YodC (DUF2158 family)
MPKRKRKVVASLRFKIGDRIRVKRGVMDANYPDIPLGGWAGKIAEVHEDGMYTIRWNRETLANIHPVYRNRCEIDGYDIKEYWLGDDDLEPDPGGPPAIELPTRIETKPLSPRDQDDRIRMVFGLTSNDPLPDVDDDALETYRQHLAANLAFPFEAEHTPEKGPMLRRSTLVKVTGLGDPDGEPPYIDDMYGLLCDARIDRRQAVLPLGELEVPKGKPNRQLIADYCYWFWNNR